MNRKPRILSTASGVNTTTTAAARVAGQHGQFLFFGIAVVALLQCGCATTQPYRANYGRITNEVEKIALISDVVIGFDFLGTNDYICIQDSTNLAGFEIQEAKALFERKGYQVASALNPFVAGFYSQNRRSLVADKAKEKPRSSLPPFFTSPVLENDGDYKQAMATALPAVTGITLQRKFPATDCLRAVTNIQHCLSVISNRVGAQYALMLISNGRVVSQGKRVTQIAVTGLLTLGALMVWNVTFCDSHAALVDLKNSEILWASSWRVRQLNPATEGAYRRCWGKHLLGRFPDKLPPAVATASTPDTSHNGKLGSSTPTSAKTR